jgi:uncharacterized protein YjdB
MRKNLFVLAMAALLLAVPKVNVFADETCNHNWVQDDYEAPTCEDDGEVWYYCTECDDYKKEVLQATGVHTWSEWETYGNLCEDGTWVRECSGCYKTETKERKADETQHVWSEWEVWSEPDCRNDGKEERECENCYKSEYKSIPSEPDLHNWSEWWTYEYPTVFENGTSKRECYACGIVETENIDKLTPTLTLSDKSKTLKVGKTFRLMAKQYSDGDYVKKYTSSNKKVVTVDISGNVKAKSKGTAKITVKMKSGIKAVCKIKVK